MRVCLICTEIFAWGKYGGFGKATRLIGRELARRGVDVCAVIPRRNEQKRVEDLDGIRVYGFGQENILESMQLYRQVDADIYHSEEPSLGTYLAMKMMPERKHVVTFRDVRLWEDWKIELNLPSVNKAQVIKNWLYEDNPLVGWAVRRADAVFSASNIVGQRAVRKYHLHNPVTLLPTPVIIPQKVEKAEHPVVCFVARIVRRKRPELFYELAKYFPQVQFVSMGPTRDIKFYKALENKYGSIPNLEMNGFVDQFSSVKHSNLLEKSWILVNTAAREGLPNSFIEAGANRCAILSSVNPDNFVSDFGYFAKEDDFEDGLKWLLENDRWREQGEKGYRYVSHIFEIEKAIQQHLDVYQYLLGNSVP
jgi:glycosyltransferase involved in cell wall biosynthesis